MTASGKVIELERLVKVLSGLRARGAKVVLCHGVFDLLHIGHIKHLEKARGLGDVLIVTVTPDRFVNKGPHRPAFTELLRAEALAALDCVDYVAVNRWPTAVEVIRLLRPSLYVKGADYKKPSQDRTGGIGKEERAVRAGGGRIAFTEEITFSSSGLINRNLPVFPKETRQFLEDFGRRHPASEVVGCLDALKPLKVLAVGETILDEYCYCEAIGKSAKEPMLALKHLSTERFAGGILAVANHLAGFAGEAGVLTVLGGEKPQESWIRGKLDPKVKPVFLGRAGIPTIVKRRFVESYFFMKMLEVYELDDRPATPAEDKAFCSALERLLPRFDLVVVVDFGHGMLSPEAVRLLSEKAAFLAVNAQSNAGNHGYHTISRYPRADYVCMAENEIRLEARDRHGDIRRLILDAARRLKAGQVVVTRGKYGSVCWRRGEGFVEVPAFAGQVMDRMGAGDAFLSVTALCAAAKVPMEVLGFIGNAVGAQAVATVGNRTPVAKLPLVRHIESLLK